ncbi:MAG TPA: WecB/TagA/CpsF family glycosyltransferase [Planctomycetota bacterium]|nr:WecB/TagA/CpsF family glycosyltransferase [Planctomycetota bacterium]
MNTERVEAAREPAGSVSSSTPPPAPEARIPESLVVFGTPVHNVTTQEVLDWVVRRIRAGEPSYIVTSNLDFMMKAWQDPEFHRIHLEADLVLPDGMPMVWFSRLFGPALKERVPGSDLVPRLAELARDHGASLYTVGAGPGVAQSALGILQERYRGLRVAGCDVPPMAPLLQMDHPKMLHSVQEARPDIVLVAFGAPKQEKWIRLNLYDWKVPVAIGVGGSLDFIAGVQSRAPRWLQVIGLEWFWRLMRHPRRLMNRYSSNLIFLFMMMVRLFIIRLGPLGRGRGGASLETSTVEACGAVSRVLREMESEGESAQWLKEEEPRIDGRAIVLDVSGFTWLNSLELGALVRLAQACRNAGALLFLSGVSRRIARLIRLFRLDRHLEIPDSEASFRRQLQRSRSELIHGSAQYHYQGSRLTIVLPREFDGYIVHEARQNLSRALAEGAPDEIVVNARQLDYLDCSGGWFVQELCKDAPLRGIRKLFLVGFSPETLAAMQKDGFAPGMAEVRDDLPAPPGPIAA